MDGMTDRLSKKREAEVYKLRKNIEECKIRFEAAIIGLQKKQQDSTAEMGEQIEQLQKMKSKIDKDKALIINETAALAIMPCYRYRKPASADAARTRAD